MPSDAFRPGELVQVKSPAEILATLDERGALDALPFMPEMLQYCGQTFTVDKRASKLCDTLHPPNSRRIPEAVLLGNLRCDGSGHDGCQAECRLFWKEAWLRRVEQGAPSAPPSAGEDRAARAAILELLARNARRSAEVDGKNVAVWTCQATDLYRASKHVRTLDPRPYLEEFTSGNVPLGRLLKIAARAAVQEPLRRLGLYTQGALRGTRTEPVTDEPLNLQPGEWVQVKSKEEILATLNARGKSRGLWFDVEMLSFCGGTYRVRKRVSQIIDERNGQMIAIKSDCVMLEGVACSGDNSVGRWFCSRAIIPYWRECWLRRASEGSRTQAGG